MLSHRTPSAVFAAAFLGLFVMAAVAPAQETVLTYTSKPAANSEVRVVRVFDGTASRGMDAYQVRVRNLTGAPLNLGVTFNYGNNYNEDDKFRSDFVIRADANGESIHQLLVPVAPMLRGHGSYYYSEGRVTVSGSGFGSTTSTMSIARNREWPTIGISDALSRRSLSELNDVYESSGIGSAGYGNTEFGMRFDAGQLPGDWRGYSGLDALMITTDEWRDTPAAAQQSLLAWTRFGGRLVFYTETNEKLASLGIPSGTRSLGSVEILKWDGDSLPAQKTYDLLSKTEARGMRASTDYHGKWGVQEGFPGKDFNTPLIVLLLIAFGVTVGPINLFVFAKAGKRHRLFVTTPLISIIASLIIAVLILISDGVGGSGSRLLFVDLQPDPTEKKAFLIQEQFSRSGVLMQTSFDVDEAAVLTPLRLKRSRWYRDVSGQYRLGGDNHSGDWFLSRSEQAQFIEAARPTRSRIELRRAADGETPPELFSSADFSLESLHYIDADGKVWKAAAGKINAGESIELSKIERNQFVEWWKAETLRFSESLRDEIRLLPRQRNVFFGISVDPKVGFIETLGSIRWKKDRAVVFGSVLPSAGAQAAVAGRADKPAEEEGGDESSGDN